MNNKKLTTEEFIKKAIIIHGNKYDYSLINYINSKTKVEIICPIHGKFKQVPSSHLNSKNSCPKCGTLLTQKSLAMGKDKFIEKSELIHNNKYNYSQVNYTNIDTKVEIICKKHGSFFQIPWSHLKGHGCKKCQYENNSIIFLKSLDEFILDAKNIHGNKYNYNNSIYLGDDKKISIICPIHGEFYQTPSVHLQGGGCSKCSQRISKKETEWIDYLCKENLNIIKQQRIIINDKKFYPDGFDPTTNTIYEFYGDFWHGNILVYKPNDINIISKKTFKQLNDETINRKNLFISVGYKVIDIWELDFDKFFNKNRRSSLKGIIL